MIGGTTLVWFSLLLYFGLIIGVIVTVSTKMGSSASLADMRAGMINVTVINTIMTIMLAGIGYFYVYSAGEGARGTYLWFLVHLAVLLSVISVSASTLQRLDAGSVAAPGAAPSSCPS